MARKSHITPQERELLEKRITGLLQGVGGKGFVLRAESAKAAYNFYRPMLYTIARKLRDRGRTTNRISITPRRKAPNELIVVLEPGNYR